ncbi:MAG: tRNA pseudouridine(13) synthase TruD [Planctomycetota bacterium]|jgi:tRNA pseudouridine13 synthase
MGDTTAGEDGSRGATIPVLPDPLPRRYVTTGEGVGGRIKVRPEDFLVDELPLYEPCGKGEHLYLGIEKNRVSHGELLATLSRHFRISPNAVGFAGMKDKHGITRQTVSLHLLEDPPAVEIPHERIRVLWAMRHRNKIRRGHLRGNRFSIRIREIDATKAPRVLQLVRQLQQSGVPCSFGPQRFGYRCNNHIIGASLLRENWWGALEELLGTRGTWFPDYQRPRRELYDAGRFAEAVELWTPADRTELIAIKALAAGQSPESACLAVGRTTFSFWLSSLQSAVFNSVLERRLAAGRLAELGDGDLAWKHDNGRVFAVSQLELDDPETARRLDAVEISPTGPLWGTAMVETGGAVRQAEEEALQAFGFTRDELLGCPRAPKGGRRPLRVPLRHVEVDAGIDEHGHYVRVAFDLPPGAYATVVLRELTKAENDEAQRRRQAAAVRSGEPSGGPSGSSP